MTRRCKMSSPSPAAAARPTADLFSWRSSRSKNARFSADQIIARLRPKLGAVPGASLFLQAGQDLRIGGRQSSAQYQYTIQSENLDDLVKWGPILLEQMKKLRGFTEVNTDQQNNGLQASLVYDRATAARLGISPQTLDQTLYHGFWAGAGFDDVFVAEPISRRDGSRPAIFARPAGTRRHLSARNQQQRDDTAQRRCALRADHRAHRRESPGTIPGRHALVQSRAGICLERRREGDSANGTNNQNAGNHTRQFCGHAPSLSAIAGHRAVSYLRRAAGGLYCAGNSLRKLHPSAHDSSPRCRRRVLARCWRC